MNNRILSNTKQIRLMLSTVFYRNAKPTPKRIRGSSSLFGRQGEEMMTAWTLSVKALGPIFAYGLVSLICFGCGGAGISLGTPVITGITPSTVARGSSITITGSNLNGTYTTATFVLSTTGATYSATASSGTTSSVIVVVPTTVPTGTFNVDVVTSDSSGDQSSASNAVSIVVS